MARLELIRVELRWQLGSVEGPQMCARPRHSSGCGRVVGHVHRPGHPRAELAGSAGLGDRPHAGPGGAQVVGGRQEDLRPAYSG